jgi:hypothetical protein
LNQAHAAISETSLVSIFGPFSPTTDFLTASTCSDQDDLTILCSGCLGCIVKSAGRYARAMRCRLTERELCAPSGKRTRKQRTKVRFCICHPLQSSSLRDLRLRSRVCRPRLCLRDLAKVPARCPKDRRTRVPLCEHQDSRKGSHGRG